MCRANNEKWKKRNNWRNRSSKLRKDKNASRKENYYYLGILEVEIIKQVEMKDKI